MVNYETFWIWAWGKKSKEQEATFLEHPVFLSFLSFQEEGVSFFKLVDMIPFPPRIFFGWPPPLDLWKPTSFEGAPLRRSLKARGPPWNPETAPRARPTSMKLWGSVAQGKANKNTLDFPFFQCVIEIPSDKLLNCGAWVRLWCMTPEKKKKRRKGLS